MIIRIWLALGLSLLTVYSIQSQNITELRKEALQAMERSAYSAALEIGEKILSVDKLDPTALYVAGESARRLEKYSLAENYLERVPEVARKNQYRETDFWLGQTKKFLGKYDEAISYFNKYLAANNDPNDLLFHLSKNEIQSCEWASRKADNKDLFNIHEVASNVNEHANAIAPLRYADKIYFTAIHKEGRKKKPVNRIYSAIQDYPARLEKINPEGEDLHAANVALMPDASRMYYTICKDEEGKGKLECDIWYRDRQYEGHWGHPIRLPRHVNKNGYTSMHPSVGWDMFLRKYILYFSSDRPGGEGGLDIWGTILERDGSFGEPFNAPFNTPGDEVTPFFYMPTQTVFFSSNGLPAVGGYDIYRAVKVGDAQWQLPVNMGKPLNSEEDDFYFTYHTRSKRAYFTSNRNCIQSEPFENCETEIFDAEIFAELQLKVFHAAKGTPLSQLKLTVLDTNTGDLRYLDYNAAKAAYTVPLEMDRMYAFLLMADGYKPTRLTILAKNLPYAESIVREIRLEEGELTAQEQQEIENYYKKLEIGDGEPEGEVLRGKVIKP